MKVSVIVRKGISEETIDLIDRLVELIPWPARRQAMGDVTITLLEGKERVAENVFGWGRDAVKLGMNELRTGITCANDISERRKPKAEEKDVRLIEVIREIMEPYSESDSHLRTELLHTNITAQSVYNTLLQQGWTAETLPTVRTISNILQRHNYKLRSVVKSKVQKNVRNRCYF